jgi:hypothetical protein
MAISQELKTLVAQLPDADGSGRYTENIDKEAIEKTIAAIHEGGAAFVAGLVEMLDQPGTQENLKPHYALHCLANHVLVVRDEPARAALVGVLCEKLGDAELALHNKEFLCQTLQWAGRQEACAALGRCLHDEGLVEAAAMALVAIRQGSVETLRTALPQLQGKCRMHAVYALAALADPQAAGDLKSALQDDDREVRIAGGLGLAKLAVPDAAPALLAAADKASGWERIQHSHHCMLMAETLLAAGEKAAAVKIYQHIRETRDDEPHLRDAAERALAQIG